MSARPNDDDGPVLVAPGIYELIYVGHETKRIFEVHKLYMHFEIATIGEYYGTVVTRYYAVECQDDTKRNGRYKAGWKSDHMREHVNLFGERPRRKDEIPITPYKQFIILGRIETVTRNRDKQAYPEPLHYSRVAELLEVVKDLTVPSLMPTP